MSSNLQRSFSLNVLKMPIFNIDMKTLLKLCSFYAHFIFDVFRSKNL